MTKKNIFPVVATIAVVGVVLGVFSTTVLRDSNVSISTMTSEQAYAVAAVIKLKLSLRQMNQVLKPLSESLKKQNSIRDESRFFRTLKRT